VSCRAHQAVGEVQSHYPHDDQHRRRGADESLAPFASTYACMVRALKRKHTQRGQAALGRRRAQRPHADTSAVPAKLLGEACSTARAPFGRRGWLERSCRAASSHGVVHEPHGWPGPTWRTPRRCWPPSGTSVPLTARLRAATLPVTKSVSLNVGADAGTRVDLRCPLPSGGSIPGDLERDDSLRRFSICGRDSCS